MLHRLAGSCFALLAAAVAIYVAARLIESVEATLIAIASVIGGLFVLGFIARLLWRRHQIGRW